MKSALYLLGLIAVTEAAGSSSTATASNCYLWTSQPTTQFPYGESKQWKGTPPNAQWYYATSCGKPNEVECIPCTPPPYEKPLPIWKKINDIYQTNTAYNVAASTIKYGFLQNQYSKASQYSGAIDYIQWCQNAFYGIKISYRLKDFCNGTITE